MINLRKKNYTDVTNWINVTETVNFVNLLVWVTATKHNMLNILLSWSDKVQLKPVVILLLEGGHESSSGWRDAAVSLDVDAHWAEMTKKEDGIAWSISRQRYY